MSLLRKLGIGVSAGLAGSAVMHGFRLIWERTVSRDARHTIFGFDDEADANGARLAYQLFSRDVLPAPQARRIGIAMHYGLGTALGVAYQFSWPVACSDNWFGILLWLCADEIPISAVGISDPFAKSAASHTGALAAHLIFGGVTGRLTRLVQSGT